MSNRFRTAIIESKVGRETALARRGEQSMQRPSRFVFYWVLFCAAVYRGWSSDAQAQSVNVQGAIPASQHSAAAMIAAPPQQAAAWNAPESKLPREFVSAADALFRQGLADPRGCLYCAIELDAGVCLRGNGAVVSTHGWLIPTSAVSGPRFAICWNGVVYPLVASGKPADLRADVLDAIKADQDAQEAWLEGNAGFQSYHFDEDSFETSAASHQSPRRLWACLLLRLGEVELAEKSWAACAPAAPTPYNPQDAPEDPYLDLAEDWTWAFFHRAVYAHMRGDDRLALLTATMLVPIWEAVQAEAAKRGYPQPGRMPWQHHKPSYLEEISPIRELLADQQRRAAERQAGKSPPVTRAPDDDPDATFAALRQALRECPDEAHRIALLVQQLEEISAPEDPYGGLDLASDPVVRLLIEAGEPAVEPLLACLEDDTRLTRSVHFSCEPIGVSEAAYVALAAILETDFFGNAITRDDLTSHGKPGRTALAKRIRGYFDKYKGLPQEERWYRILLDDRAPMSRWVEAAQKITQPAEAVESILIAGWLSQPIRKTGDAGKLAGEPLRSKKDPTVSALLSQRAQELPPARMGRVVGMALARWDPHAALPVLRVLTQEALAAAGDGPWQRHNDGSFGIQPFIELILARAEIHDPQALEEFGRWARTVTRKQADDCWHVVFTPLLQYSDEPAARATAEWLFNDQASPWNPIVRRDQGSPDGVSGEPLASVLLTLPAFRRQVARLLAERRPMGRATMTDNQTVELQVNEEWGPRGNYAAEAPCPPLGTTAEFRVCDLAAHELSATRGLPRCELCWAESERDVAVAACARLLQQYGERFQVAGDGQSVSIAMPPLDHPATPEDVQAGRAFFSLAGQGATRVVQLPQRPAGARWSTLKDYPISEVVFNPKTNQQKTVAGYDQNGVVWQVEEVRMGDAWKRYFGFVGRHCVAKVPAEEIDFSYQGDWAAHVDGSEVFAIPPGELGDNVPVGASPPWIGGPLAVAVSVRNCTGLDRRLPRFVIEDEGATRPKDCVGLSVGLSYADRQPGESFSHQYGRLFIPGAKPAAWRELPRKADPLRLHSLDRELKPLETFQLLRFDLRDHFHFAGAGWYRIVVKLATGQMRPDEQPTAKAEFFIEGKPVKPPK